MSALVTYTFVWHSLSDACPKCQDLNGRQFFEQDIFQNTLKDSVYGDIWNLDADHTLAHPNCRCQLEVHAKPSNILEENLGMLKEQLILLRDEIKQTTALLRGR